MQGTTKLERHLSKNESISTIEVREDASCKLLIDRVNSSITKSTQLAMKTKKKSSENSESNIK